MPSLQTIVAELDRSELLELAESNAVGVDDRQSREQLVAAVLKSPQLDLRGALNKYPRDRLKELCRILGLDDKGKQKADLADRLVSASPGIAQLKLGTLEDARAASAAKPEKPKKGKGAERRKAERRGASEASAAAASGTLKAALRQFSLGAAGGYQGREAVQNFTTHLLECFGWKGGRPDGAAVPAKLRVAADGQLGDREVALWWPERRVMLEVVPHDAILAAAWKDLLRACLQMEKAPQFVVLTNQRDLHLYDLARDKEQPRLAIAVDDLARYSEAFPFFQTDWKPGMTPVIVSVERVSKEVADLVAKVYRSVLAQHPNRQKDVIRFTLQCITAMFAEDIGLLPKSYFTSLLYNGAKHRDAEARLRELFEQMNAPKLSEPRVVPYFNGGLFTDAVTLPIGDQQLIALTKAAEADWTYVDPHIFGSVFQGVMDDAERHASGAHYTAHEDIMRVVGPTIVEPWRRRIDAAKTLKDLTDLRAELFKFRVLDPACGSGNFLYVAFRELYRLDTELLSRMRGFKSAKEKVTWAGAIQPSNFFGIDINPFAVELAKVTLNIAKKIAFEERKAQAAALSGQVEMDVDPSLPLDNLDQNIVCADALFSDWPQADAIVGNPPFLGGSKIRAELGADYLEKLQGGIGANGIVDLACYWFQRAHDRLATGARAGLVATSGIRVGKQREASLDYVLEKGGTITSAVSSREWPGDSAVNVSMVNWVRGPGDGPFQLEIDDTVLSVAKIHAHLQLHSDVGNTAHIVANSGGMNEGVNFGHKAFRSGYPGFPLLANSRAIKPVATADDLLRGKLALNPEYCLYLSSSTEAEAEAEGGAAFQYLRENVFPQVKGRVESGTAAAIHQSWIRRWWQPWAPRTDFFASITNFSRLLVTPKVSSRPSFAFVSKKFVPNDTLKLFAHADDYSFGVLQSNLHWEWTRAKGSRVRQDIQYTTDVWRSFAWPQDPAEQDVVAVAGAARRLRRVRLELMAQNGWSLRALNQAAEVAGPHPLKETQAELDEAVRNAYGVPADQDPIGFLLELNQLVAEDESQGRKVRGPGLPTELDPKDPRWTSTDCIEPPPLPK